MACSQVRDLKSLSITTALMHSSIISLCFLICLPTGGCSLSSALTSAHWIPRLIITYMWTWFLLTSITGDTKEANGSSVERQKATCQVSDNNTLPFPGHYLHLNPTNKINVLINELWFGVLSEQCKKTSHTELCRFVARNAWVFLIPPYATIRGTYKHVAHHNIYALQLLFKGDCIVV